jgi:hypothetical protein
MMRSDIEAYAYPSMVVLFIVQIVFGLLKLTNQLDWSWWWVLSPFVIPITLFFGFGFIIILIMMIIGPEGEDGSSI